MFTDDQQEETVSKKTYFLSKDNYFLLTYFLIGGLINAVKIVARIVTPYRFANKGHYLSYSGLVKHEKISGGRSYGKKNPRYCRMMKSVYKSGVLAAIRGNNPINNYYEYLIADKNYPAYNARHKACRQLAIISFGVFKSGKKYKPHWRNHVEASCA